MDTSILIENLKANVDVMVWLQAQTILRDKYKENAKRWRENNPEKHREYRNKKNKEYYHRNKSVLNKKRVEYYHIKKARDTLADEEALVAWNLARAGEEQGVTV
jgi:CRISPR/Cas system-associated protein Cas5 (RAMP superfamily)